MRYKCIVVCHLLDFVHSSLSLQQIASSAWQGYSRAMKKLFVLVNRHRSGHAEKETMKDTLPYR